MARFILLLETGVGGFELESSSGVILLETSGSVCSGSVTVFDQPLSNVTVSWTGPTTGRTTTDSFGEWFAQGLVTRIYEFTPTLIGYSFIPPSQFVAMGVTDVVEVNFIADRFFTAGQFPPSELHISYSGAPGTVLTNMNNPDNTAGTSTIPTLNENLTLVVIPPPALQGRGEVRGRFDQFNVINNPA